MTKKDAKFDADRFSRTTAGYIEIVEKRLAALKATPEIEFEEAELQEVLDKLEQVRQQLLSSAMKADRLIGMPGSEKEKRDMTAGAVLPRYVEPDFAREEMYVEPDLDSDVGTRFDSDAD